MPPRSTRRRFLELLGVGVAAACFSWAGLNIVFAGGGWFRGPVARITAHFDYLKLERSGVEEYVRDLVKYRGWVATYLIWPSDSYVRYLMSTDFFKNGADEGRTVGYVGFYDPYLTPCSNPFDYDAE